MLARFFHVDAIATVIQFMTVYALVGAVGASLLAERIGPRRVVLWTLAVTIFVLVLGAGSGSSALLWVLGPIIGISLDRKESKPP